MNLVSQIAELLLESGESLATSESCTGGLLGHHLTNLPGSSEWYVGGVVAYNNSVKHGMLGVRRETLDRAGAVSAEVAEQMALGARQAFDTTYAISVTGIAGPGGSSDEKPVGLTYIGVATPEQVIVRRFVWNGCREGNKRSSVEAGLGLLAELLRIRKEEQRTMPTSAVVDATFEADGKIRPRSFTWNGHTMKVTDWGRQWEQGGVRHFLVMTPDNRVWELCFTPAQLHWSVEPRTMPHHIA